MSRSFTRSPYAGKLRHDTRRRCFLQSIPEPEASNSPGGKASKARKQTKAGPVPPYNLRMFMREEAAVSGLPKYLNGSADRDKPPPDDRAQKTCL